VCARLAKEAMAMAAIDVMERWAEGYTSVLNNEKANLGPPGCLKSVGGKCRGPFQLLYNTHKHNPSSLGSVCQLYAACTVRAR
jgi:hypothetical protein